MALTVSTPFASGTVNTASGTTITLATGTATSGWVGRVFVLNRGTSRGGQWRKITGFTSSTEIEIEYPWRTGLGSSDPDYEELPQNADAFHISYNWDDIDDGTNITKVDASLYRNTGGLTLSGNITIFSESLTFDFQDPTFGTSNAVVFDSTSGLIFGNYNSSQLPENGCFLLFNFGTVNSLRNVFNSGAGSTGLAGDFMLHACVVNTIANVSSDGIFMRLNASDDSIVRFIDTSFSGSLSGRIRGNRSIVLRSNYSSAFGSFVPFTVQSPVGQLEDITVSESDQVAYWRWQNSGSGVLRNITARNIFDQFISISGGSGGTIPRTLDLTNTNYDGSAPIFIQLLADGSTSNKTINWNYSLQIQSFLESSLDGGARAALYNVANTEIFNELSADGNYSEAILVERTFSAATAGAGATIDFADGTLRAPYVGRFRHYGFVFLEQIFSADSQQIFNWFKQANGLVTSTDSATALAITNPITADQVYDHGQATYELSANMQYAEKIKASNNTLLLSLNVVLNSALAAVAYDLANDLVSYSALINGSKFTAIELGANRTLSLAQATTYLGNWAIPATGTVEVSAGTTNLSSFTFANGATIDNISASAATVTVAPAQLSNITSLGFTGGGAIVIISAPVNFTGFPTGNNANGVAYNSVLAIQNTDDATLFTADASSGSVSKSLSEIGNGVGPFLVWGDGVGLIRSQQFTVLASRTDDFSFSGLLEEFTAEDGTPIIGLETAETGLTYDAANTRFELDPGDYTFHGLAYQKELITSSQGGQSYNTAAVRGIQFIQNDAYKRILIPSPFKVSAAEDAATSPIVTDCLVLRSDGTDPFEHGLSSTASGLTNRPEIVISFQAPTAITAQFIRDAMALALTGSTSAAAGSLDAYATRVDALIEDSSGDRFTAKALETAPKSDATLANQTAILADTNELQTDWVDGGRLDAILDARASQTSVDGLNDLSQADIRAATGLASANLDTQLGDIPTVSEFNVRTIPSADYFDPTTDTVANVTSVGTTANLTNLPTIPNNWLTAAGLATDAVAEIQSGLSTFNGDLSSLATAANLATVDTVVDAIKEKTDQFTFTVANQVDANALTGGGGDDAATIYSYFTALTRPDVFKADVSGLSAFDPGTDTVTVGANNDKTGYSLAQAFPTNFANLAIDGSGQVWSGNMRGTDAALTALPTIPTNWLTADGLASDAVVEIQNGLATSAEISALNDTSTGDIRAELSTELGRIDTAISSRLASTSYTAPDNAGIANTLTAAQAAELAATASADGRFVIDYADSTATQYNANGTVRTVFNLRESDGITPATTAQSAVERVPQ